VAQKGFGTGWLIGMALAGLATGGALVGFGGAYMLNYSTNAAAIANATVHVALLERLQAGDVQGASKIVQNNLHSALVTLEAVEPDLTADQKANFSTLKTKAATLMGGASSDAR
jgi:hypothetical protein